MYIKLSILRIIALLFLPVLAQAAVVERMYEVSLSVTGQQKDIRNSAFEQGFIEVLVRVSGNGMAPASLDMTRASRYVQKYRYLPLDPAEKAAMQQPVVEGLEIPLPTHKLWMQFNEGAIKKLLRDNGLPIWGKQRPSAMIWIAVRDGQNRYILKQQDVSVIKDSVTKESTRRGLPLVWPRMDREDQQKVLFADVWGSFWDPIMEASKRYSVDAVIVGRMNWVKGSWDVDWSMMLNKKSASWRLRALDLELLMASGIDVATDQISRQFAVLENMDNSGNLVVQVNGIGYLSPYAKISRYLSSLAPVKNVYVSSIKDNKIRFNIDMTGDKNDLQRVIALGKVLSPDQPDKPEPKLVDGKVIAVQVAENLLTYKLKK